MDMSSLFPPDSGMANLLNSRPTPHISFKAGVLTRDPTTNMVTADPRKGIFQIVTSTDDGLLHLQWRAKNTSTIDHDLILFNGETEMKQVTSCPASARVYVLKWREANTRMFFWMQGKDPSADAPLITSVNNILENGPDSQQVSQRTRPGTPPPGVTAVPRALTGDQPEPPAAPQPDTTIQPSTPPPSSPAPAPARAQITLEQMRQAFQNHRNQDQDSSSTPALAQAQRELILTTPNVPDILNYDILRPALSDPKFQEAVKELFPHLPEYDHSMDGVEQVLRSPQLRSQAAYLSHAFQSGQASDILRMFHLPTPESADGYAMRAFLDGLLMLQRQSKERKE